MNFAAALAGPLGGQALMTIRQSLWPDGPLVHPTNYPAEGMSKADRTKPDLGFLSGRPLAVLEDGDHVICGAHEVDVHREMVRYLRHLGVCSLNPDDIHGIPSTGPLAPVCQDAVQWAHRDPEAVRALLAGARHMVPVIVSPDSHTLAMRHGLLSKATPAAVDDANNKGYLPEAAGRFGFLTPPTHKPQTLAEAERYFKALMQVALDNPEIFEQKIWVKLRRSSGGEGVKPFPDLNAFLTWLNDTTDGKAFCDAMMSAEAHEGIVMQLGVRARAKNSAPNINFYVGRTEAEGFDIGASAQAIERGSIHVGNNGPLDESDRKRLAPIIKQVSCWLRSIGFSGVCGIDVIMGVRGDVWVIDINARWNASTSTLMLFHSLRHLPGVGVFRYTGKIRVPARVSVNDFVQWLETQHADFDPNRGGVVPLNFMTAYRDGDDHASYVQAAIFGPDHDTVGAYFNLAQMPEF